MNESFKRKSDIGVGVFNIRRVEKWHKWSWFIGFMSATVKILNEIETVNGHRTL
jgi:hypothetical protein